MNDNVKSYLTSFSTLKLTLYEDKKILLIELNRPKKLNTFNLQLFEDLNNAFKNIKTLTSEVDVRVIILRGSGKHFSAGLDLSTDMLSEKGDSTDVGRVAFMRYNKIVKGQEIFSLLEQCHIPIIASVSGYCLGAGINLIPCCDYAICSKDTVFSIREAAIGIVPDLGVLQRLVKNGGNVGLIKKYSLTGEFFKWETALKMRVVYDVAEDAVFLEKTTLN